MGTESDVVVRLATLADSHDILAWRNDQQTRQMSRESSPVSEPDHAAWFDSMIERSDRLLTICGASGKDEKVGVVRFDLYGSQEAEISINLAPTARGRGFAKACLKRAIEFLQREHPNCTRICAEIREDNVGSIRSFEGVGFVFIGQRENFRQYELAGSVLR